MRLSLKSKRITRPLLSLLFSVITTFLGIIFIIFFLSRILPIDPVLNVVGDNASHETYLQTRAELGLDQPLYKQFFSYLGNVLKGNLGRSLMTSNDVWDDLMRVFPATIELASLSLFLGALFGIPLGILSAIYQHRWIDKTTNCFSLVGYSVPTFWFALIFLLLFYYKWDLFPGMGRVDFIYEDFSLRTNFIFLDALMARRFDVLANALHHIALPALVLAFFIMAYITRMTRTFMIEQLGEQYILTAKAKGLSTYHIFRHAFQNIRAPLITLLALSYGGLLEGAVLTETIFAWPGLGLYLTQSLKSLDMNAILGAVILIGIVYLSINALSNVLNSFLDVRIRRRR